MEFKIILMSFAVFSCLMPPALSSAILATKAAIAAKGAAALAVKGASAIKKVAVKGAAIKGAALSAAKGVAVKGATVLAAKGSILKGAALLAKGAVAKGASLLAHKGSTIKKAAGLAVKGAAVAGAVALGAKAVKAGASLIKPWFIKPVVVAKPTLSYIPVYEVRPVDVSSAPAQFTRVLHDRLDWLSRTAQTALDLQNNAVGELVTALHDRYPNVAIEPQREKTVYDVPIVQKTSN